MNYDFDREDKGPLIKRIIIKTIVWIIAIAMVVSLAYFLSHNALEKTMVLGTSMESTLKEKDEIIINKYAYLVSNPKRFDVIVFKQTNKEHSYLNIKRIIGLPGETVQIIDGIVYINGEVLNEATQVEGIDNSGLAEESILLEENEYFVLGDNRNNSEDSRFANIGNIVSEDIIGKALARGNDFAFIDNLNKVKEEN
ncbi:MAG: signal peptidase I [Anaerocolumna sp.]